MNTTGNSNLWKMTENVEAWRGRSQNKYNWITKAEKGDKYVINHRCSCDPVSSVYWMSIHLRIQHTAHEWDPAVSLCPPCPTCPPPCPLPLTISHISLSVSLGWDVDAVSVLLLQMEIRDSGGPGFGVQRFHWEPNPPQFPPSAPPPVPPPVPPPAPPAAPRLYGAFQTKPSRPNSSSLWIRTGGEVCVGGGDGEERILRRSVPFWDKTSQHTARYEGINNVAVQWVRSVHIFIFMAFSSCKL